MKKPKPKPADVADYLADLSELAGSLNVPDECFDGDIDDTAKAAALLIAENVKGGLWLDKLEYLHQHGYQLTRLKQLILDAAKGATT